MPRIHETDFCHQVGSWADQIFANDTSLPFASTGLEGFGSGSQRAKRKDLGFYDRTNGHLAICGEVRLPGAAGGRSPYDQKLVEDASAKAENAGVQYFFTWNVNVFVLWDRSRWREPLLQRRVRQWTLGMFLRSAEDVARSEVLEHVRTKFLPSLIIDLARIYRGQQPDWPMPPDDIFLRSLESHLDWPIDLTRALLASRADKDRIFDKRLQEWLTEQGWIVQRKDSDQWGDLLDHAAQTLVHLLANRLIFYQSLRARFPDLPRLELRGAKTAPEAYAAMRRYFQKAVDRSGDYEPLFYADEQDWAGRLVFEGSGALEAWRGALKGIEGYDFSHISSDVVGKIFQRLVSPEERRRWGQHFTGDDVVDLVNAFCIRSADGAILDPACGSGSFLVRGYYRKRALNPGKSHAELLSELFGCDIAMYPAHLATLNLAAREINQEANYPRITRRDFFDVEPSEPFCKLPPNDSEIPLPPLAAVVGNPPYVRQEKVGADEKRKIADVVISRWPGLRLSGRSDIHCYFWPAAAKMLKEGGYFGFLTSSSWLDVEYGFALQRWILQNFRLVAVMESAAEPWFPDARIKTCVTILRRCADPSERMASRVKFVRFKRPLAEIIREPPEAEEARFRALDELRDRIESATEDTDTDDLRIIVRTQGQLWNEGVRASKVLAGPVPVSSDDDDEDSEADRPQDQTAASEDSDGQLSTIETYTAGKWGRYLRAPGLYFEVMRDFGSRFVPLGEIASIRRGVTSGCDAFFMPFDISREALETVQRDFKRRFGVDRPAVERGEVKIVKAGDGSVHPIEAHFLRPEVHTLRDFRHTVMRVSDCDRVILLVDTPLQNLKGTCVARYVRYGETHTFSSGKSRPVPVPHRSTCAAREPWYDLTKSVNPGFALWPMAHHYRHVIPYNPDSLICNHRMFDIGDLPEASIPPLLLTAILNSTLIALFKTFYGRFTGTEGSLDTEVIDVRMLEVPDPHRANAVTVERIRRAFEMSMTREVGFLVEESLLETHSPERARAIAEQPTQLSEELHHPDRRALDDAVFELLGVSDPKRREQLVSRLYEETARHFRQIRVVEIQKMEQRSKSGARRFSPQELAADAWDAVYLKDLMPIAKWVALRPGPAVALNIPADGEAGVVDENSMFDRETVFFGKGKHATRLVCASREQAELVARLATLGLRGEVPVPESATGCREMLVEIESQLATARNEFEILASSRTADEKLRNDIVGLLMQWLVHGRPDRRSQGVAPAQASCAASVGD
ncbi:MAG: N-6 DNA methylase [Candidatus Binataceae bacterium]